jgi:hypothetical protein
MSTERMSCCGALTRTYSDAGHRRHAPNCKQCAVCGWRGVRLQRTGSGETSCPRCDDSPFQNSGVHLEPDSLQWMDVSGLELRDETGLRIESLGKDPITGQLVAAEMTADGKIRTVTLDAPKEAKCDYAERASTGTVYVCSRPPDGHLAHRLKADPRSAWR